MKDIFVKVQENTIGPLSPKKIESLVEQGIFTSNDFVWNNQNGEWVPAGSVDYLAPFFHTKRF